MSRPLGTVSGISLRGTPVEQSAMELVDGDVVLATVNTILRPEQDSEARAIARELASGLESGETEPTTSGIEPFADRFS